MKTKDIVIDFWNNYVEWYELWLEHNDYPRIVLDRLLPLAQGKKSFLDIGAGTGIFALPIASLVSQVTCVEPAEKMRQKLLEKAAQKRVKIACFDRLWEELSLAEIGPHDLVLAAHSFYEMQNFSAALRKMVEVTEKELLIVVRASKETGQTFKQIMDELAKKSIFPKPKPPKPALEEVINCLAETGYPLQIEIVEYPCSHYYHSLEQAGAHWLTLLGLEEEKGSVLASILKSYLKYANNHFFLPETTKSAFVHLKKGGVEDKELSLA